MEGALSLKRKRGMMMRLMPFRPEVLRHEAARECPELSLQKVSWTMVTTAMGGFLEKESKVNCQNQWTNLMELGLGPTTNDRGLTTR